MRMRNPIMLLFWAFACGRSPDTGSTNLSEPGPEARLDLIAQSQVLFGEMIGVIADSSGRMYVADSQSQEIVVLSAEGRELHRIGGRGSGPGEFGAVQSIAWKADTLAALDFRNRRISLFDRSGELITTVPWPTSAGRPHRLLSAGNALIAAGSFAWQPTTAVQTAAAAAARFRQPAIRYFEVNGPEFRELGIQDTVAEPGGFDCDGPGGTIAIFGEPLSGRLGPLRGFQSPDTFISAEAHSAQLNIVSAGNGDVTRSIRLDIAPVPVSDSLWAQQTAEYREREEREGPFACNIEEMRLATLPRIRSILPDVSDRLWVEVRIGSDQFAFVIMDWAGEPSAVAAAPSRDDAVAPYARGDKLYVVYRDEHDVQYVQTYRVDVER